MTLLERETAGGTIVHYPRAKVVMTGALEFAPPVGTVRRRKMSKEELVELWQSIVDTVVSLKIHNPRWTVVVY